MSQLQNTLSNFLDPTLPAKLYIIIIIISFDLRNSQQPNLTNCYVNIQTTAARRNGIYGIKTIKIAIN